ncbi:MAG: hypothetical protein A3J24_13240 [Deltaproteobacteria bacterium RIFCSPLOWO2_02_FULL_53_8]|nr:MAG: hypothetical protein A3J24_13240 [Deltaproteobacteria bacterium RIFCSPLOWO2_02_FULL_53_8]
MNDQEIYISRVCQTALFFWEIFEEKKGDGDTRAIELLKPTPKVTNVKMRDFVLNDLFRSRGLSLTEAAIQLAAWLNECGFAAEGTEDIEIALRSACAPYERKMRVITDVNEVIDRSYIRLARYIRQIYAGGAQGHTRVFDYFIPLESIPTGRSHSGISHPEHVVPCAVILKTCLDYFAQNGQSLDEVVKLIRKLLVIVYIAEEERKTLDTGSSALKDKMPPGWDLENGCIFARLHSAKIEFDAPPEFACTH